MTKKSQQKGEHTHADPHDDNVMGKWVHFKTSELQEKEGVVVGRKGKIAQRNEKRPKS